MKHRVLLVIATLATLAALALPTGTVAPAGAATCVSGADIKQQVSTFVHSLRDDVKSADARRAARAAFVESVKAARGAKADTPAERAALGQQISALAKQLKSATNVVERKALIAEIAALVDQKKAAPHEQRRRADPALGHPPARPIHPAPHQHGRRGPAGRELRPQPARAVRLLSRHRPCRPAVGIAGPGRRQHLVGCATRAHLRDVVRPGPGGGGPYDDATRHAADARPRVRRLRRTYPRSRGIRSWWWPRRSRA